MLGPQGSERLQEAGEGGLEQCSCRDRVDTDAPEGTPAIATLDPPQPEAVASTRQRVVQDIASHVLRDGPVIEEITPHLRLVPERVQERQIGFARRLQEQSRRFEQGGQLVMRKSGPAQRATKTKRSVRIETQPNSMIA
jgi:hypothetical protein